MLVRRGSLGCFLPLHWHVMFEMDHEYRISVDAFKVRIVQVVIIMTGSPKRPLFSIKPELAENSERMQWHSRKYERPKNSIISFLDLVLSLFFLVLFFTENDDIERKEKSLFISKKKAEGWKNVHMSRSEKKNSSAYIV